MKVGVCLSNYGKSSVDSLREVSLECESLGYDSIWLTDHILMSSGSGTPYERFFESVTTASYLSALTKRVKIGFSVLIVPMRNPVIVAKQLAMIDVLSGGRLILGVGAGWNEQEFKNLGVSFEERGRRLDDSLRLIRNLWSGDREFHGKYIDQSFEDIIFEPRPIQKRLEIWVGGTSVAAMKRAIRLGDAWHPIVTPIADFRRMIEQFRAIPGGEDTAIGARIGLDMRAHSLNTSFRGFKQVQFCGNLDKDKTLMNQLVNLGLDYLVVTPDARGVATVSDQVHSLRRFARQFL